MAKESKEKVSGVLGENPGKVPGEIFLDDNPSSKGLEEMGRERLAKDNSKLKNEAERDGQDVVAVSTSGGKRLWIGVKIAAYAVAIASSAVVLYVATHKKTPSTETSS